MLRWNFKENKNHPFPKKQKRTTIRRALCLPVMILALLLPLPLILPAFSAHALDTGFHITDYRMEGTWHENNTVTVTEHIDVNFTEDRHGIYRTIPLYMHLGAAAFGGEDTISYQTRVKKISVSGAPYDKEEENGEMIIRIGSESLTVQGDKSYDISYTYEMPDDRIDTMDFLYYSPLGPYWDTTIDHFSFRIQFDKPLPQEALENMRVQSGDFGNESNALNVVPTISETEITGEASGIGPEQAITFFTTMPDGYFSSKWRLSPFPSYAAILAMAAAILTALVFMFRSRSGKPVRTVQFYPPEGMCSAEIGVIQDEAVDDIDLVSLIPYWAQRGHLTMEETGEGRKQKMILKER